MFPFFSPIFQDFINSTQTPIVTWTNKYISDICIQLRLEYVCLTSGWPNQILPTDYFFFLLAFSLYFSFRCCVGVGGLSPRCVSVSYSGWRSISDGYMHTKIQAVSQIKLISSKYLGLWLSTHLLYRRVLPTNIHYSYGVNCILFLVYFMVGFFKGNENKLAISLNITFRYIQMLSFSWIIESQLTMLTALL